MRNIKKWIYSKTTPDTTCVRKGEKTYFRAHYLFRPKLFLAQHSETQEKL